MDELEEMREQLSMFKARLDKEEIINEKLMREVTHSKVRKLNRNVWQMGICALFVITFGNYSFHNMGLSNWFLLATTLMMIICFLATLIPHSWVKKTDIFNGNFIEVTKQVLRLKKLYIDWKKIGIVLIIIWGTWLALEVYSNSENIHMFLLLIIPMFVGGTIGGIIGWKWNKKLIAEMDEIVKSIKDYSNEAE